MYIEIIACSIDLSNIFMRNFVYTLECLYLTIKYEQ